MPDSDSEVTPSRRSVLVTAGIAAALFLLCTFAASDGRVPSLDREAFERINGWPDGLGLLEVPMQLGTLALLPAVAVVAGFVWRRPGPVVAIVVAAVVARAVANLTKDIVDRGRPYELLTGVTQRDPAEAFGFPSAHAAVAGAIATIAFALLPPRWRWVPVVLAAAVGIAHVFVGVHFPLDVIGGAALGVAIGALALLVPGVRSRA